MSGYKLDKKNSLNNILEQKLLLLGYNYKIINAKNVKIILAGMIAPSSYGKKYKDSFDIIYPDLAKKFNLLFIPFLLQDVALNPELNLSDGIHPNKKGVKIISNTISKKLITILKN